MRSENELKFIIYKYKAVKEVFTIQFGPKYQKTQINVSNKIDIFCSL